MSLFHFRRKKKKESNLIVQENPAECIKLIEQIYFKGIFTNNVTDLSYNGKDFFVVDNDYGRKKLEIKFSSEEMLEFIKKIANYMLHPFSTKSPSLDISFGSYRLSAIHPSLARTNNQKVVTFSLRMISATVKIKPNDPNLCPIEIHYLLKALMSSYQSVIISGQTGSGKTEFQKYLISLMNPSDRIILIEESYETHIKEIYKEMDVTSWISDKATTRSSLIKLALRNNPDWILLAEARGGEEMIQLVETAMTGHGAITTIHSEKAKYSLDRVASMSKKTIDFDEKMFLSNIAKHIKIGIHLEKVFSIQQQKYIRRIDEVVEYYPLDMGYEVRTLYELIKTEKGTEETHYKKISRELKQAFIKHNVPLEEVKKFIMGGKDEI